MEKKGFYDEKLTYDGKTKNDNPSGKVNQGYVPDSADSRDLKRQSSTVSVAIGDKKAAAEEEDPWKVTSLKQDFTPWHELDRQQKVRRVLGYVVKSVLALATMYVFICSLDFLSSAFKLLGGEAAGKVFQQSDIFTNPIAGLMMGVLVTVLVQSSSTSTSIVVSMVGGGLLDIKTAIPIVMGANIGTSVTNTIVAMGQISDKGQFRRAFAGATVHDMFNWLAVIILLPIEVATGYLYHASGAIVDNWRDDPKFLDGNKEANKDILKVVTKPFTELIIQINKNAITDIANNKKGDHEDDEQILKLCCDKVKPIKCCKNNLKDFKTTPEFEFLNHEKHYTRDEKLSVCAAQEMLSCVERDNSTSVGSASSCLQSAWSYTNVNHTVTTLNCASLGGTQAEQQDCEQWFAANSTALFAAPTTLLPSTINKAEVCQDVGRLFNSTINCTTNWQNVTYSHFSDVFSCRDWADIVEDKVCNKECDFLFRGMYPTLKDKAIGGILLVISLALLCTCLVAMVKLLHSLLEGPMAILIKKFVNADFPGVCGYFTGYLAILVGAGLTIVVQSSSIFTSTLTPLVGIGVIEIDRMYPLTLGSNIGTTTTAILASLANSGQKLLDSLQVSLCHLIFNLTAIVLFYPVPRLRFPIPMAKFLGERTATYRWFAIVYIIFMFFLLPGIVFALSIPGWWILLGVMGPFVLVGIIVVVIKICQNKCPHCLPHKLRDFKFVPKFLRSLEPYDRLMRHLCFCQRFQQKDKGSTRESEVNSTQL